MDVDAYLRRLGMAQAPSADLIGLAALEEAHLHNVPFENLDIPLGHGIHLDQDHIFEKIIHRQRGGYCFELNGLFGRLLDALGFARRPILARVWYRDPPKTPPLTHVLNLVTLPEGEFLADVGFGGTTARVPIKMEEGATATDADGEVRLIAHGDHGLLLQRKMPDDWQNQFSVTGAMAFSSDMELGNHFTSSHPSSHFTHASIAGRFTPQGRVGLVDWTLTTRTGWETTSHVISSSSEYKSILATQFGIDLGDEHERLISALPKH